MTIYNKCYARLSYKTTHQGLRKRRKWFMWETVVSSSYIPYTWCQRTYITQPPCTPEIYPFNQYFMV